MNNILIGDIKYVLIVSFLLSWATSSAQVITNIAGNDTAGFAGDGGLALMAELHSPCAVTTDDIGNLYISDSHNNRIRCVNTSGVITTFCGDGFPGYSGDGEAATNAELNNPSGIAADRSGNIYIADFYNNCIRKVTTSGLTTTVAGNGTAGFSGDGGPATLANLFNPTGIATDDTGNIYIADVGNSRIRKVDTSGVISTIAGNGLISFNGDGGPAVLAEIDARGVAIDNSGNIYIADYGSSRIRKVNNLGIITTIAGNGTPGYTGDGGPATNAELYYVTDVAVDQYRNVFIADVGRSCIRKVDSSGIITTVAGNGVAGNSGDGGPATAAELNLPIGIAVDGSGNLYIADFLSNIIREIIAVNNGVAPAASGKMERVMQMWPDPCAGSFYVFISAPADEPAIITIAGVTGQIVKKITAYTNSQMHISLDVDPGTYFVIASADNWSKVSELKVW